MPAASSPLNHCPAPLVPIMLEVLAAQHVPIKRRTAMASEQGKARPVFTQGIHEKTLDLGGTDFDLLMVLFYNAFGSAFSCTDTQQGISHTLSFLKKPTIVQEATTPEARRYRVHVTIIKLPTH